ARRRTPGWCCRRCRARCSSSTSASRSVSAAAATPNQPSTPTGAWSPSPPERWSSAIHPGPGPSACTSSHGAWHPSCRCPRPSCGPGRRLSAAPGLGLVRQTSSVLATTRGAVPIGDLTSATGVSSTHLAHRFKQLIGVPPKRLARTYRFAATVFSIDPAGPVDWARTAYEAGYFDQAHFGHDFRAFTGYTPTRYVQIRRQFLREHPGHVLDSWPLPAA